MKLQLPTADCMRLDACSSGPSWSRMTADSDPPSAGTTVPLSVATHTHCVQITSDVSALPSTCRQYFRAAVANPARIREFMELPGRCYQPGSSTPGLRIDAILPPPRNASRSHYPNPYVGLPDFGQRGPLDWLAVGTNNLFECPRKL